MILTEPLIRVVKAARGLGCTYLLASAVIIVMLLSLSENVRPGQEGVFLVGVVGFGALYGVPGLVLLWLARRLAGGALWAAFAIMSLGVLVFFGFILLLLLDGAQLALGRGALCGIIGLIALNLPTLVLIGVCLSAYPEIRHLRRSRLRATQQFTGGFPVVPVGSSDMPTMASVKPPPRPNADPRSRRA